MSLNTLRSFVRKHRKSSRAKRVSEPFRPRFEMLEARNLLAVCYVDSIGGDADSIEADPLLVNVPSQTGLPFFNLTQPMKNCFTWLLCALAIATGSSASGADKNIVLLVVDDMSQDAGCYGNPVVKTPYLDSLACESTLFAYAFCTTASCSPSRAVIMTGLHNHANGQYGLAHGEHGFSSREGTNTLPVMLREAGYRTARIGRSVHVRPCDMYGFELTLPPTNQPLSLEHRLYGRDVMRCVRDARRFIETDDERPFFLMLNTCDAHRFSTRFDNLPGKPNTFANDHVYRGVEEVRYSPDDVQVPPFLSDTVGVRAELAQYYQCISRIDQGLGALMTMLRETGHWSDTLLIFISDHGMAFPGAKTTVYEPGLRCPCIIRSPEIPQIDVISDALVSWVDITPTILDYAGVLTGKNRRFHGRSLLPILGKVKTDGWDEIFASHTFHQVTMYYPMRVLRGRRYKLIWNLAYRLNFPLAADLISSATWQSMIANGAKGMLGQRTLAAYHQRPEFELYDLQEDPNELHNLATDPKFANTRLQMYSRMKEWQTRTLDPWRNP